MGGNSNTKLAFIGLGAMGQPMAEHLIRAGFDVAGFDLSEIARSKLVNAGGRAYTTAGDAVDGAGFIITMLPNGKIVQDCLIAGKACLRAAKNALFIDMSSSAPTDTRDLSDKLASLGFRVVDAPVSGGVKRAVSGSLTIMAGGDAGDIDEATAIFSALGDKTFKTGPVGSGHAMKAINNFVSGAGVLAAMEAVILGQKFGLEPDTIIDTLNASSGKNNATEVKMKQFVVSETFGSGFALGLMAKDIRIAASLSEALGLSLETLKGTADTWDAAQSQLGPAEDHTKIIQFLRQRQ